MDKMAAATSTSKIETPLFIRALRVLPLPRALTQTNRCIDSFIRRNRKGQAKIEYLIYNSGMLRSLTPTAYKLTAIGYSFTDPWAFDFDPVIRWAGKR
jgi:hypothetical protein